MLPRHRRRRPFLAVLCLLSVLACGPAARAADGDGPLAGASAEVARLFQEAAQAAAVYEQGRLAAEEQRAEVGRLEELLARARAELAAVHDELGGLARAHYRSGGGLPYAAQLLMARNPDDLVRGKQVQRQAELVLANALGKSRRAENKVAHEETKAEAARQALDARTEQLAEIKRGIETRLEEAQWRLEGEAEGLVAAGQCAGPVRVPDHPPAEGPAWVAPVDDYELSAGFDSAGEHWASRHTGQDFAVPIGTPVRAVGAGRVTSVSCGGAFGVQVLVLHDNGYYTQYAHLAASTVEQGELVRTGQMLGQTGSTGNSTGPHLHFEVRLTPYLGSGVDPVDWLTRQGVPL
ncbi:M23 family metallopeptidase [Streptomyces sp. GC420]|uniref:M23 family metallopeptidase n=1 Tax=Streptomyces sp. GC420 TaxID=2697568 RepID=UPI0014150791|nr:M23 family metallopeptidase [Streptomyces sp. GC420]NBM17533.1 peptidoglycan DD-metalloendopeptidase family protein [Streptomyces sp. GC420]